MAKQTKYGWIKLSLNKFKTR